MAMRWLFIWLPRLAHRRGFFGACPAPVSADPSAKGQVELRGGRDFPRAALSKWIDVYTQANPNISNRYQGVGSGEGSQLFLEQKVDFGASDAALSDEQIAQAKAGVTLVPTTAGIIVLAYNLPDEKGR